ncbi:MULTISPECIES: glycosyltransferase family 4 protein [Nocardiaceae]|uniref:glycosyltransferase family 4 protein n=1 Tax=Nocardiaceae TaxID=85025 RepID=UPI001140518D|nr:MULTISPECIES: glycosyltransferase family 4 protein [Rhodococcus]
MSHTAAPGGGDLALARYLSASRRSDLGLLAFQDGPIWDRVRDNDVQIELLENRRNSLLSSVFELRRRLKVYQSTFVVANSMRVALILAVICPRKHRIGYWVRDGLVEGSISFVARFLTRNVTLNRTLFCLANSNWTASTVLAMKRSMDVHLVYSPSGLSSEVDTLKESGGSPFKLIYLGRIAPWKGVDIAIAAVAALNEGHKDAKFNLDIAGTSWFGEDKYMRLIEQKAERDPNVRLLGHVDDVQDLLSNYDGLLHCSTSPEPFGQVIVQGMAAGLIVFATKGGGPEEIVDDETNGVLVPPGNPEILAAKISSVFSDRLTIDRLRVGAQARSKAFSDRALVLAIDAVLSGIEQSHEWS